MIRPKQLSLSLVNIKFVFWGTEGRPRDLDNDLTSTPLFYLQERLKLKESNLPNTMD